MISKNRIAAIKITMNLLKLPYTNQADFVHSFTDGRTTHVSEMEESEAQELFAHLKKMERAQRKTSYADDHRDRQRKAIIAIFKRRGKTVQDAIRWAEQVGVRGVRKRFDDYDAQELYLLSTKAELLK